MNRATIRNTGAHAPGPNRPHRASNNMQVQRQAYTITLIVLCLVSKSVTLAQQQQPPPQLSQPQQSFPGVSRELSSFCAARPSLPVELASMVVHVKKNVSFNYKLYLFADDHVFQTGQVIPRDDFRVHAFPVKLKRAHEFWPQDAHTQELLSDGKTLKQLPSGSFEWKRFFAYVPLVDSTNDSINNKRPAAKRKRHVPEAAELPGETTRATHDERYEVLTNGAQQHTSDNENLNKYIKFDRDDQLIPVTRARASARAAVYGTPTQDEPQNSGAERETTTTTTTSRDLPQAHSQISGEFAANHNQVVPVGAFSSFHVNTTYLVRKDFGERAPQIVRVQIDADEFVVRQVTLIASNSSAAATAQHHNHLTYAPNSDYEFLSHKLLRSPRTRITAINQMYEDWITRNFYTLVYIQRKLDDDDDDSANDEADNDADEASLSSNHNTTHLNESQTGSAHEAMQAAHAQRQRRAHKRRSGPTIVNERLVFRGSSIALLGADQLDYLVKAAAFITEKNGLHYYLEFLSTMKFYMGAIDWSKRPFSIVDARRVPIKPTRTQFDNEELLLCPPAVCFSSQPVDEIVAYGRLSLADSWQAQVRQLTATTTSSAEAGANSQQLVRGVQYSTTTSAPYSQMDNETSLVFTGPANQSEGDAALGRLLKQRRTTTPASSQRPVVDRLADAVRLGASSLNVRLHLRDWTWPLTQHTSKIKTPTNESATTTTTTSTTTTTTTKPLAAQAAQAASRFDWRYELAKRNDLKVKPDTYGYAISGHEIEASYRVYNELYLISVSMCAWILCKCVCMTRSVSDT